MKTLPILHSSTRLERAASLHETKTSAVRIHRDAWWRLLAMCVSAGLLLAGSLHAQGTLDPTFNSTGKVVTAFGSSSSEDKAAGVAIQSDGKIVVAGTVSNAIGVARYLTNGALDTSFSGDGLVTTTVGFVADTVTGVAIQSDGKIVVCGSANFGTNDTRFSMVRFNTDGTLDTTFDTDGKVNTSLGTNSDLCNAIAIQSDGKIVLAGYANSLAPLFAAARYNTNGSLDTTFDTDGIVTVSAMGTNGDQCYAMTIQSDGKIVLVGGCVVGANFDTALARLNTNGSLDTTFSGDGKHVTLVVSAADLAFGVAQQTDGKLVLTGYSFNGSTDDITTLRYTTAGALDATWDGDGIKITTVPSATVERGQAITIQADQKIVVAGIARFTSPTTQYDLALLRFNSNSTLDTTFDGDGIVTTAVGSNDDMGRAVRLQADGRIVVVGETQNASFVNDFAVARYLNSVPVPEIGVEQPAGTGLTDGSSTVAFGTTSVSTSLMRTFTITNSGTGTLNSLAVTKDGADAADFTVGSLGATSLAPNNSTTFTVTFTPSSAGAKVAAIHIASDDLDENPFDITLNGTGALISEIVVEQPAGTALTDGTSSINCGSVPVNTPATAVVFTIKNIGSGDMTGIAVTKDGTHAAEFTIDTTGMLTTVPAGQQTTFTVTATPGAAGVRTAAIHIASDDLDENPFDITVTSTGLVPEIAVEQPAGTNLTDNSGSIGFGTGMTGSTSAAKVFTIKNTGLADLTGVAVTKDGAGSADYTVDTTGMTTTVAPGGSTTFSVTFSPSVLGARPAALHIASNDSDENPFDITLTGEGIIPSQLAQQAYGKASNTGAGDVFGASVAISGDTVVVGAYAEDSDTVLINGNQASNAAADAGAVYVFTRNAGVWTQQAYIKPFNTNAGDQFGYSVDIDGDTLVVGANLEDSNATTINGDGNNNAALQSGAVYVFTRSAGVWTQQAYIKPFNTGADDQFGNSVSVSGDSIVVGAYLEDSNATGINGNGADNSVNGFGAAYVFTRSGVTWSQQAYLKGSHTGVLDQFGISVAISGDTVVVGEYGDDSNASGVNGDASNNSLQDSGAAFVFTRSAGVWSQQAYLKASNPGSSAGAGDLFGFSSAIDGDTIVIGAYREDSNAAGVGGNQADNSLIDAGAAYVFTRSAGVWSQQAYLKASNPGLTDQFGRSVALSGDTIVVSANQEDSAATGVLGDQASNGAGDSGAAYVFIRGGSTWLQQAYLKASNTGAADLLGNSVGVSGGTVIAGAHAEDSNATGIGGNQADNSLANSGAVYIFTGLGPADITVEQPVGTPLTDGGTLNVGDQGIGVSGPPKTFTITNSGISPMLGISVTKDGTHAADYALDTSGMSTSLAPGASTTFTVTFTPGAAGTRDAALHIACNDVDENPFDIALTGSGGTPEIALHDGANTSAPQLADGQAAVVDFGYTAQGTTVTRDFTISNTGTAALTVSSITAPSGFTVLNAPGAAIAASATHTFQVRLDAASVGTFSGSVTVNSNDADEAGFDFPVSGTVQNAPFHNWATGSGLSGADLEPTANPAGDGLENLIKYAFNMNPAIVDVGTLTPGTGTAGLPAYATTGSGATSFFRYEFIRRIGSGLVYTPKKSPDLLTWSDLTSTPTVTAIDANWERVVHLEPFDGTAVTELFGMVEVTLP